MHRNHQHRKNRDQRTRQVQRSEQILREDQPDRAADQNASIKQVEWKKGEPRAQAKSQQQRTKTFDRARWQFLRADPFPGQYENQKRKQERGSAEDLKEGVGKVRTGIADEINRMR